MAKKPMTHMTIKPADHERLIKEVDWSRQNAMTDDDIARAIEDDPDASQMSDTEIGALHVQAVRRGTGLSQSEFAARFCIPIGTLRDWEQGRREPDTAALAYLRVIAAEPDAVIRALAAA